MSAARIRSTRFQSTCRAALLAAGVVVALWATVFFAQRRILFPAPPPRNSVPRGDAEAVRLMISAGPLEAWFLPTMANPRGPTPLILFAHGNGELAADWIEKFDAARHDGFAVLLVEYPGYGHSSGSPSEESIGVAVRAAFDWAKNDTRVDSRSIIAYGRSLGGAVATELAATRPVRALVLQSSFASVPTLSRRFLVPSLLIRDSFDNLTKLGGFHGPLLVLHGDHDSVVPIENGRALAHAVSGGEFVSLPCGHNDCPDAWPEVHSFLSRVGIR